MTPIETYLDNIFYGLPNTGEMAKARRRLQESMEEKFEALRSAGKSEAEALGLVVAEFGSVSELLRELGQSIPSQSAPQSDARPMFPEEEYQAFRKKFSIAIAAGVCLCILGVVLGGMMNAMYDWAPLVIPSFFIPVAAGVSLFIYFGIQEGRYSELKETYGRGQYQGVHDANNPGTHYRRHSGKEDNPIVEAVNSLIMMLATVIFLVAGFTYGLWHPGWIVFPVGGILCGMISIIGGIWR